MVSGDQKYAVCPGKATTTAIELVAAYATRLDPWISQISNSLGAPEALPVSGYLWQVVSHWEKSDDRLLLIR
ncbi:hypothetical protein D9M72_463070 [compost metagenome]